MDIIKKSIFFIKLFFIGFFLLPFLSCKKKDSNNENSITPQPIAEISSPVFETDYGNCYDYPSIGKNPITFLSSNDLIVSSVSYDGINDKLQVSKINAAGTLIWQKTLINGYKFMSGNCFETSNNELIVVGTLINQSNWTNSKVYIAKLNLLTSDTIWTKTYGYSYIDIGITGYEDLNNNYWIVDFNQQNHKATFLKINSNGDSLTSIVNNEIDQPIYEDALVTSNKDVILVGEAGAVISNKVPIYICSYGINGNKKFANSIVLNNFDQIKVNDVCESLDGNYIIGGECYNFSNSTLRYGFLVKVNQLGNKMWEKVFDSVNGSVIYSVIEKNTDIYYLGAGNSGNAKLYKYDFMNFSIINSSYATSNNDLQLLIKNNKLYRALIDIKPTFYETVKVKQYNIN